MWALPEQLERPIRAAERVLERCGVEKDRREVLQNGSTLVVRLSDSVVARVVQDVDGPRRGLDWFRRENALVRHLTRRSAPIIPLHTALPPGPYEEDGYALSFWEFVEKREDLSPDPREMGRALRACHAALEGFEGELPELGILEETLGMMGLLRERALFGEGHLELLEKGLREGFRNLGVGQRQALHGDAHPGNALMTRQGVLWTDWEDAFVGPVEWDLASLLWNAKHLEADGSFEAEVFRGYREGGGCWEEERLEEAYAARAAVMTAWYPLLYPKLEGERGRKLEARLLWLERWDQKTCSREPGSG